MNFREWRAKGGRVFTCGRPGRATFGTRRRPPINEDTIDRWVEGLPEVAVLHIVSLLGQKTDGVSEFAYYPFRSSKEPGTKPTFQEWLDERYGSRFIVHEFPTVDARPIPSDVLETVKHQVFDLIDSGKTVVVMDSAGAVRAATVCEACGYERMA